MSSLISDATFLNEIPDLAPSRKRSERGARTRKAPRSNAPQGHQTPRVSRVIQAMDLDDDDRKMSNNDDDDEEGSSWLDYNAPQIARPPKTRSTEPMKVERQLDTTFDPLPLPLESSAGGGDLISLKQSGEQLIAEASLRRSNSYPVPFSGDERDERGGGKEKDAKLDFIIHLLELQQDERTGHVTEDMILYGVLGVFVIFTIDGFVKIGKHLR